MPDGVIYDKDRSDKPHNCVIEGDTDKMSYGIRSEHGEDKTRFGISEL